MAVQNRDGRRASRLRCFARSFVGWLPGIVIAATMGIVFGSVLSQIGDSTEGVMTLGDFDLVQELQLGQAIGQAFYREHANLWKGLGLSPQVGRWLFLLLPGALFVGGAVFSLFDPERGVPDRIVGTRLVPL